MNRKSIVIINVIVLTFAAIVLFNVWQQCSAIDAVKEWARLADFPENITDFKIETEGGPFSRAFRLRFKAEKQDLDTWLNQCPGLKNAKIETDNGHRRTYIINPGGGAAHAEMTVDIDTGSVEIYTYWS